MSSLRNNDLQNTVLKKISIDEFEPKTGDERDVAVVGFYVSNQGPGKDLYNFLNGSVVESRDIEVSPNPNDEGYYMVFLELDRNEKLLDNVRELVREVERVSGPLAWQVKTPYIDDYVPLTEADGIIQLSSSDYRDAADYREYLNSQPEEQTLTQTPNEQIMEFLGNSNLLDVDIQEGYINLRDARGAVKLEIAGYGYGPDILSELSISESAIKTDFDAHLFGKLRSMLGEMRALPIDNYVVIYDPARSDVLVTKPC
jgi:hypothetical protein